MNLGIIKDRTGKVVNHRSLIKVVFNPFLRMIGLQIGTVYDFKNDIIIGRVLCRCLRQCSPKWRYHMEPGWYVDKRGMIF